ncbi:hypothetical protein LNP00_02560 [Fructobacillus sp. M158]|uniref:hypothetical protein n=1 Tax=Fructobacillus parabroussonetiae TaxID=2713174 RepID=UPI00200B0F86|nr:hypothetical protein [Fructobacillus parabroussonetiae]MCK8617251.1 hypothetical protein [Fructobacillus parabroussonetiae]
MVWYFWAGLWLAVLLLVMIWRFLYRMLPKLSFIDLAALPSWLAFYFIEGAAFYRSDFLLILALLLLLASLLAFLLMGKNDVDILRFTHLFWRFSGLLAILLVLITILAALFNQFL